MCTQLNYELSSNAKGGQIRDVDPAANADVNEGDDAGKVWEAKVEDMPSPARRCYDNLLKQFSKLQKGPLMDLAKIAALKLNEKKQQNRSGRWHNRWGTLWRTD